MKEYLLAHDLGTSGDKATLFTTEGELVDSKIESYPVHYYNGNWAEQDAEDWWNAFVLRPESFWRVRAFSRNESGQSASAAR